MPEPMSDVRERPLRIALFTHSVNPRGGVVHTVELGEALQALGHAVTLFLPTAPGQHLYRTTTCTTVEVPVPPADPDLATMAAQRIAALEAALPAWLQRHPFDVLHAQDTLSGNALATLQTQRCIGRWLRTVHHLDDYADPRLTAWQLRGFQSATEVLCVSALWRDTLLARHNTGAWRVHNGVNLQRYEHAPAPRDAALRQRLGLRGGGPVCLTVGGVEARKNTHRTVQAFASLHRGQPDATLLIAGGASLLPHDREQARYQAALTANGLSDGPGDPVRRLGTVDDADMPALFRLADVLLMPSLNEGFGLVALEALACGTPVVVPQCPPFVEHLRGEGVHWCDPLDTMNIAAALRRALAAGKVDPPAWLGDHGWDRTARLHEALYRCGLPASGTVRPVSFPSIR